MKSEVTVVVPTSPIPSHPSTAVLEETVGTVRYHFPDAEIILTFDGPSPGIDSKFAVPYEEYIRKALWLADKSWGAVCPHVFRTHHHQSGMMKKILDDIRTPYLLYVEHDAPIVTDEPIEWDTFFPMLEKGRSDLIRLHHEAHIPEEHEHMMHGQEDDGSPFMRTSQWSQRPHLATTAFYRRIMDSHFGWTDRQFIEDVMHGVCDQSYRINGMMGWWQYRLHLYVPDGNIKRSWHLDGAKSI